MSVQRLIGMTALLIFIVFVAAFFTVLVRLSRIGVVAERYAYIVTGAPTETGQPEIAYTRFDLLGQDNETGQLKIRVASRIDTASAPFNTLTEGSEVVLRIENLMPELRRNLDLSAAFHNPTGDRYVNLDFGGFDMDILDHRDFYPFEGYELIFNFGYYVPGNWMEPAGTWFAPQMIVVRSLTNLILLNPRYGVTPEGNPAFKMRVAHLRILQFITVTLMLVEILFLVYLLTIINLQELLTKSLGYLVGLFIIRDILVTRAPQFPTLIDYSTLFLICVVFFLMLFKFIGGAEERALITIPPAWRDAVIGAGNHKTDSEDDGAGSDEIDDEIGAKNQK